MTGTIPYDVLDQVTTTTEVRVGERYLTWYRHIESEAEIVTVTSATGSNVYVAEHGYGFDHPNRGTGRKFAAINPPMQADERILIVEDAHPTGNRQSLTGETARWINSDKFWEDQWISAVEHPERGLLWSFVRTYVSLSPVTVQAPPRTFHVGDWVTVSASARLHGQAESVYWGRKVLGEITETYIQSRAGGPTFGVTKRDYGNGPVQQFVDAKWLTRAWTVEGGGLPPVGTHVTVLTHLNSRRFEGLHGTVLSHGDNYTVDENHDRVLGIVFKPDDHTQPNNHYVTAVTEYIEEGTTVPPVSVDTHGITDEIEEEDEEQEPQCDLCEQVECRCVECDECGESRDPEDGETVLIGGWHRRYYCMDCVTSCNYCGESVGINDAIEADDDGSMYCSDCIHGCNECGDYNLSPGAENCDDCGSTLVRGINGYGHTYPDMWLGGPLPRDEDGHQIGFYIGFELEVSSSGGDVDSLRRWAHKHLGSEGALDPKEDGSVEGFEIATQPMTPSFFEGVDWESFMDMLEEHETQDTSPSREPVEHGLHVHVGRVAFDRDDVAVAMFAYLLGQGDHLERIGRRAPTHYCSKVKKPLSAALVANQSRTGKQTKQAQRLRHSGVYPGRDAINLSPSSTIEIRAFRSTRNADDLRAAVRVVYLAAQYIGHLRGKQIPGAHGIPAGAMVSPRALHWDEFMKWVKVVHPAAIPALDPKAKKRDARGRFVTAA